MSEKKVILKTKVECMQTYHTLQLSLWAWTLIHNALTVIQYQHARDVPFKYEMDQIDCLARILAEVLSEQNVTNQAQLNAIQARLRKRRFGWLVPLRKKSSS